MTERPDFRGLGARLLGRTTAKDDHPVDDFLDDADTPRVILLPVESIQPNPDQPRKFFDEKALQDLTTSIRERGVLQPIIARKDPAGGGYFLIAGERRWRAATSAGLAKIPTLIREKDDPAELALIENIQREDLSPLEEAEGLLRLKEARGFSDAALAAVVGKSRQSVNDLLALNRLPEPIKSACRTSGSFSKSQLLELIHSSSDEQRDALWATFQGDSPPTVRALRATVRSAKGRLSNFVHAYKSGDGRFRLTITFSKPSVSHEELREAIEEVLGEL